MACCVLRVSGASLDPELVLQQTSLSAVSIWHEGDQRSSRPHDSRVDAGFVIDISDKKTLYEQIQDAIVFLTNHRHTLLDLSARSEVTRMGLDFGIVLRDVAAQYNRFPVPLIQLAAEFKIELELSQYACE